jgi:MFS family permease
VLADRIGRRKCIVYGTATRIVSLLIYILATSWEHVVPGLVVFSLGSALIVTAKYPSISESISPEKRGAALGYHRMILALPRMFVPFFGGIYMDLVGVASAVSIGFRLQLIAGTVAMLLRAKFVRETLEIGGDRKQEKKLPSLKKDFSSLLRLRGSILVMLLVGVISTFALQMAFPFLVIYAVDVIGLTKTQWGLVQSVMGIIGVALSLPGGLLADRVGRKPLIFLSRFVAPFQRLGLVLLRSFDQVLGLHILVGFGAGLGGAERGVGGPAWTALTADLIPSKDRAKVTGLMALVNGIASMLSSIVGGYLWTSFSPDTVLISSFSMAMASAFIFYLFVKEPKQREK